MNGLNGFANGFGGRVRAQMNGLNGLNGFSSHMHMCARTLARSHAWVCVRMHDHEINPFNPFNPFRSGNTPEFRAGNVIQNANGFDPNPFANPFAGAAR